VRSVCAKSQQTAPLIGAAVAAWPAVALVGSYELLMLIIRSAQEVVEIPARPNGGPDADPVREQATRVFAGDLAATRVPSMRAIRGQLLAG
jgi:hypothetical protein